MKRLTTPILNAICFAFFLVSIFSCESSYNEQSSHCFDDYSSELDGCAGDEDCELNALTSFQSCQGYEYQFPVNFVVLTDSLKGSRSEVIDELEDVIDTLNKYFTAQDLSLPPDNRRRIVSFRYKSATLYSDAMGIGGDLVDHATPNFNFSKRQDFQGFVNDSDTVALFDRNAINIYIVDCWDTNSKGVYADISDSHGKNNGNRPYAVIDYARINGKAKRAAAEEHEMGHCFSLVHVCTPGSTVNSTTNIMSSANKYPLNNRYEYNSNDRTVLCSDGTPPGRAGKRNLGFNSVQCRIILNTASEVKAVLEL